MKKKLRGAKVATATVVLAATLSSNLPLVSAATDPGVGGTVTGSTYGDTVMNNTYGDPTSSMPPVVVTPSPTAGTVTNNVYAQQPPSSPKEALDDFNKGNPVVIKYLFVDPNLAAYFASWVTASGLAVTVDDTLTRDQLKSVTPPVNTVVMYPNIPFNASGKGITSLVGMGVFSTYTGYPYTMNFSNNQLTNVDGLEGIVGIVNTANHTSVNIDLSFNQITNLNGLTNLAYADNLLLNNNQLTSVSGLSSLLHIGQKLDLHNNLLTTLSGLQNLEPSETAYGSLGTYMFARTLNFSNNRITDATTISQLVRVTNLYLNNNNLADLSFLANLTNATLIDVSFNKLVNATGLNEALKCTTFNDNDNYMISPSSLPSQTHGLTTYPQNSFQINQGYDSKTVIVEYRDAGPLRTLLDSETFSGVPTGVDNIYNPKTILGYQVVDATPQTVKFISPYNQLLSLKKLRVSASKTLSQVADSISNYTMVPEDISILKFVAGSGGVPSTLQAVGSGVTKVGIYQDVVYLGSYSVNVHEADINTTQTITFYYNKVAVPKHTLTIFKDGDGTTSPVDGTSATFNELDQVTLTATPAAGSYFVKWSVNGVDYNTSTIPITMDTDKAATAYFAKAKGKINVKYVDEYSNDLLPSDTKDYDVGQYTFSAKSLDGYQLTSPEQVAVSLQKDAVETVTFQYKKITGQLVVEFLDQDTKAPIKDKVTVDNLTLGEQSYTADKEIGVFSLIGDAVQKVIISVEHQFQSMVFYYKKIEQPAPVPVPTPEPTPVVPTPTPEPTHRPSQPVSEVPVKSVPTPAPVVPTPTPVVPSPSPVPTINPSPIIPKPIPTVPTPVPIPAATPFPVPVVEPTILPVTIPEPAKPEPITPIVEYGTIYGYVKDSSGKPMVGVQVELHSKPRITYTDIDGKYVFENAELGSHTVLLFNPVTGEQSRIYVEVFKDHTDETTAVKDDGILDVNQVSRDVELNNGTRKKRVDFIIEPIKEEPKLEPTPAPTPEPTPVPQKNEPVKPTPKKEIPVKNLLPLLLLVILPLFRRNVVIYNIKKGSAEDKGVLIKKIRVKPKVDGTVIDLTGLSAEEFLIVFKRPSQFKDKTIIVKYGELQVKVRLTGDERSINFIPDEE